MAGPSPGIPLNQDLFCGNNLTASTDFDVFNNTFVSLYDSGGFISGLMRWKFNSLWYKSDFKDAFAS